MGRLIILILLIGYTSHAQLQINEICSDNDELLQSANGEYYDWIEIYNNSDEPIQLSNYFLSDDKDELDQWNFDSALLGGGEYLIVFASDDDVVNPNEQHTNFKLSSKGESVYLTDGHKIIDRLKFGKVNEDYTYGRLEESSELHTHLAKPTPGESNRNSGTIIANRESGYYVSEFDLQLTAAAGQKIYYTTNGDDPTTESLEYTGEIEIRDNYDEYEYLDVPTTPLDSLNCKLEWIKPEKNIPRCKVISYCVINLKGEKGRVYRNSYFFNDKHKLPVVSIITDNMSLFSQDTGIYVTGNLFDANNACWSGNYFVKDWERSASISYYENTEKIFEESAGIKINGGGTRTLPQKSIKFFARKKYGINKFENVFFPELDMKEFNSLLIRTTMACWNGTIFKDALTLEIVKNMNIERTYTRPVVVYINGNYWGLSELRNRLEEDLLAEKYDVNQESINIISIDNPDYPRNGTYDDFAEIYHFMKDKDLSIEENYQFIKDNLDIDSFIDYYIAEMYFNNFDWPGNNFM
ncbi:MAG: CotH kinase family protein, partial [Candidatus Kapaibacterium sp.]